MSMTELKVSFPTEKLEALRFFMGKKNKTIEQELQSHMDKIYEKMVPSQLREYLESRIEQTPAQEPEQTTAQEPVQTSNTRERPPRQTRRRREQAASEPAAMPEGPIEPDNPSQSENQGMTMNM